MGVCDCDLCKEIRAYKKAVEETGAGDAFCVGFVSAYLYHQSLETCLEWGKRNAASVVTQIGAKDGLLTKREIVELK